MKKNIPILNHVNPFLYAQESPWITRLVGLIGLISSFLAGYGMLRFLNLNIWYQIIFGPIVLLFFYNHILKHILILLYRNFSKNKHLQYIEDFWQNNTEPSVAIFLPYCGEDINVFSQTVKASYQIDYKNKHIYIR